VDGEAGRFEFLTHSVINRNAEIQFNTAAQLFPALKARGFYRTIGFKEIAFIYGNTENSSRKTIALINRIRYQEENGTPYRTLQENTEKEGADLINHIEHKTKTILAQNNFTGEGFYQGDNQTYLQNIPATLSQEMVRKTAENFSDNYTVADLLGEETADISLADAQRMGICQGERIRVRSRRGEVCVAAKVTPEVPEGMVWMAFHFTEGNANWLTNAAFDPSTLTAEYKACAVTLEKIV